MEFEITEGLNNIYIANYNSGEYLCCKTPVCIKWLEYDASGYLIVLPYDKTYRESIFTQLREKLYQDFTNSDKELYSVLQPLLKQLSNGKYYFKFYNENNEDNPINLSNVETSWFYSVDEIENFIAKPYTDPTGRSTIFYSDSIQEPYDYINSWDEVVATIPSQSLTKERIKFFEDEIKNGKRPFAILLYREDTNFVLDGHHKLRAYYNLGIVPPLVVISAPDSSKQIEFHNKCVVPDMKYLNNNMYKPHMEYFLNSFFNATSNTILGTIKKKDLLLFNTLSETYNNFKDKEEKEKALRRKNHEREEKKRKALFDKEQKEFEKRNASDINSKNLTRKEALRVIVIILLALLLILSLTGF